MLRFGKTITFLLFAALLIMLGACSDSNNNDNNNNANDDNENEEANVDPEDMPEPDLDDVPDVVAEVNGEEIPKEEFESAYQQQFQNALIQSQMSDDMDIDQDQLKSQLADGMIGQELLSQKVENDVPDVSEDDIDKTLQGVLDQNGFESKDELFDALEEQDTDKDEFMEEVEEQAKIEKLVDQEAGDVEPSEEEIKETYDGLKKQQENLDGDENSDEGEQGIPDYEDAKPQLKEKLKGQKEQEARQDLVNKLREDADVTNHLS